MGDNQDQIKLSKCFDDGFNIEFELENTSLSTNSREYQVSQTDFCCYNLWLLLLLLLLLFRINYRKEFDCLKMSPD